MILACFILFVIEFFSVVILQFFVFIKFFCVLEINAAQMRARIRVFCTKKSLNTTALHRFLSLFGWLLKISKACCFFAVVFKFIDRFAVISSTRFTSEPFNDTHYRRTTFSMLKQNSDSNLETRNISMVIL